MIFPIGHFDSSLFFGRRRRRREKMRWQNIIEEKRKDRNKNDLGLRLGQIEIKVLGSK